MLARSQISATAGHAFLTLLDATSRPFRWTMHPRKVLGGRLIRPDATLQDEYASERGFYEAKNVHNDLEFEIRKKLHAGYPGSNIIFGNNSQAVRHTLQLTTVSRGSCELSLGSGRVFVR